jgi:hypothetical protein
MKRIVRICYDLMLDFSYVLIIRNANQKLSGVGYQVQWNSRSSVNAYYTVKAFFTPAHYNKTQPCSNTADTPIYLNPVLMF